MPGSAPGRGVGSDVRRTVAEGSVYDALYLVAFADLKGHVGEV